MAKPHSNIDWTRGADGRSNTSEAFQTCVAQVERLIRECAHTLLDGRAEHVASLIVAQLAHVHGFVPRTFNAGAIAVLLTLEWAGRRGGIAEESCCPDCYAFAPDVQQRGTVLNPNGQHKQTCKLAVALGLPREEEHKP